MSAVLIMRALLKAHAPLTAIVPAEKIFSGFVEQGESLPAISITEPGRNEFSTLAQDEARSWIKARVQVTVHTKDYAQLKAILLAAKLGPGIHAGVIAGAKVKSVRRLAVGPDLSDDAAEIYQQSRDFMVTYLEPN